MTDQIESQPFLFGVSEFTTWPWTFEEDVAGYARLGVNCIEICEAKLDPDPAKARDQLKLVTDSGLTISSVQPRLHSLYPDFPRPLPVAPEDRMALYRKTIDLFQSVAPGVALVTITGRAPDGNFYKAYKTAATEYRELAEYADDHGVRIALEPLNPILMNVDTFACTLSEGLHIIEMVDHPAFGLWLDVWHVFADMAATDLIRVAGERLFGVHVNDWRTPRAFGDRYVIGDGIINLPPLLSAVRSTGYKGAFTLEIFSEEWLFDSLWKGDLDDVILRSRAGLMKAWEASLCEN